MSSRPDILDIAFSFDTTGSMYTLLDEVRERVNEMILRLQRDIPGIRIAVIAHGDYCDKDDSYLTKNINFSTSFMEISSFVREVDMTGGGDWEECYEFVLREVRKKLNWLPVANKVLVMIGDAIPHEPSYPLNTYNIDWRVETKLLADMGVKIYGVQCDDDEEAAEFYKAISIHTRGTYLQLPEFSLIYDLIMGICYREHDEGKLREFEKEVMQRGEGFLPSFFKTLNGDDPPPTPPKLGSINIFATKMT